VYCVLFWRAGLHVDYATQHLSSAITGEMLRYIGLGPYEIVRYFSHIERRTRDYALRELK